MIAAPSPVWTDGVMDALTRSPTQELPPPPPPLPQFPVEEPPPPK